MKVSNHLLWYFLIFLFWKARGLLKPEDSSHTQSHMAFYKNNYIWHFVRKFICGFCTKHVLKICLNCFAMKSALEYSARSKVFFDIKLNKLFFFLIVSMFFPKTKMLNKNKVNGLKLSKTELLTKKSISKRTKFWTKCQLKFYLFSCFLWIFWIILHTF